MNDDPENPENSLRAGKYDRLVRGDSRDHHNPKWSRFVRRMRLILPVIALALFAVVFVWSDVQRNNILPSIDAAKMPTVIGQNELVNPRFESVDEDNQPFTITAKRAVQNKSDEQLVMLDEPLGDMKLNSGEKIAVRADRGSFRQDSKILLLRGKVRLDHDKGYRLETEELDIDLMQNTALSKVDVAGSGPDGTLQAKGLEGQSENGRLIFNGPAKLILTNASGGPKEFVP
ncbi:MAG: LPS export ABC transporter periplasmic protein LptC [Alphaproteobacteria bacterium PRO2]|nr:LPS export ABC transporter periplasmic protein LptC [Alphaproteobacteria bacterium PRO2]